MDLLGKDKLARLDEERQRRRQQRAEEASRRLSEVGKQTLTSVRDGDAQPNSPDAGPGRLSRVLYEAATGGRDRAGRANKAKRGKYSDDQQAQTQSSIQAAMAQVSSAMSTISNAVSDAGGAGLRGGMERAAKSVTGVVERVTQMTNGNMVGQPSAQANPIADLLQQEGDESRDAERERDEADRAAGHEAETGKPARREPANGASETKDEAPGSDDKQQRERGYPNMLAPFGPSTEPSLEAGAMGGAFDLRKSFHMRSPLDAFGEAGAVPAVTISEARNNAATKILQGGVAAEEATAANAASTVTGGAATARATADSIASANSAQAAAAGVASSTISTVLDATLPKDLARAVDPGALASMGAGGASGGRVTEELTASVMANASRAANTVSRSGLGNAGDRAPAAVAPGADAIASMTAGGAGVAAGAVSGMAGVMDALATRRPSGADAVAKPFSAEPGRAAEASNAAATNVTASAGAAGAVASSKRPDIGDARAARDGGRDRELLGELASNPSAEPNAPPVATPSAASAMATARNTTSASGGANRPPAIELRPEAASSGRAGLGVGEVAGGSVSGGGRIAASGPGANAGEPPTARVGADAAAAARGRESSRSAASSAASASASASGASGGPRAVAIAGGDRGAAGNGAGTSGAAGASAMSPVSVAVERAGAALGGDRAGGAGGVGGGASARGINGPPGAQGAGAPAPVASDRVGGAGAVAAERANPSVGGAQAGAAAVNGAAGTAGAAGAAGATGGTAAAGAAGGTAAGGTAAAAAGAAGGTAAAAAGAAGGTAAAAAGAAGGTAAAAAGAAGGTAAGGAAGAAAAAGAAGRAAGAAAAHTAGAHTTHADAHGGAAGHGAHGAAGGHGHAHGHEGTHGDGGGTHAAHAPSVHGAGGPGGVHSDHAQAGGAHVSGAHDTTPTPAPPPRGPEPGTATPTQSRRPAADRARESEPAHTPHGKNASPTSVNAGGAMNVAPQRVDSNATGRPEGSGTLTQPGFPIEASGHSAPIPKLPADPVGTPPPAITAPMPASSQAPAVVPTPPPPQRQVTPLGPVPGAPPAAANPAIAAARAAAATVQIPQGQVTPIGQPVAPAAAGATPAPSPAAPPGAMAVKTAAPTIDAPQAPPAPNAPIQPTIAAPQTQSTPAPAPNVPAVRNPGGSEPPSPASLVQQTVSLSGDRTAASSALMAEAQTSSRVGPDSVAQRASQIAPLAPQMDQTGHSGDAPAAQANSQSTQAAQQAAQQGHQRETQSAAAAQQQIAQVAGGAAAERAQYAAMPPPAILAQTSAAAMAPATATAQAAVLAAGAAVAAMPVAVDPVAIARSGQAASMPSQMPAFDPARFHALDQHAPFPQVQTQGLDAGTQAAAATYAATTQQVAQLSNLPPPQIQAPAGDAGARTPTGQPTREAAIARIEQEAARQTQANAPAQMAAAAAPLQSEMTQHVTAAQQSATATAHSQVASGQSQAQQIAAGTPAVTGAQAASSAQSQYAQHQATATAASQAMHGEISTAQQQAQAGTAAAQTARAAAITTAQTGYQQQVAGSVMPQYQAQQDAANAQFTSQSQQAQAAMTGEQTAAQQAAQQATEAARARAATDISTHQAQLDQQRSQAMSSHQAAVASSNAQHAAQMQQAQAQSDAQVQQHQTEMTAQVTAQQSQGNQEVNQHLQQGEQQYGQEIRGGEHEAEAQRAQAEAQAQQKREEASAERAKHSGGVIGAVVSWVKDRIDGLLDAAKSLLAAARDMIVSIMEKARQAAVAVMEKARQAALSALNRVKSAIQGIISAAASAIRSVISACAQAVRNLIQNLATALKGLVQALTTMLSTLVQAFQMAMNALLDGLLAAVSLVNKDLGDKLRTATQKYRDTFNTTLTKLQADVNAAGTALQHQIQQTADGAISVVDLAETQLNDAVSKVETQLDAQVEAAYQKGAAAINVAFDAAELAVNTAFDVAEAGVKAYFDLQIGALSLIQKGVDAYADFVIFVADKVMAAVDFVAQAIVSAIPDSIIKGFVNFWNGKWRTTIIIGLAVIAAVAITVATLGTGAPVAAILLAGVIGGTIAGTAYFGGELVAREGTIKLSSEGKGVYVPGSGYAQVGPDGHPVKPENFDQMSPEDKEEWEKKARWSMSNFNLQKDETGKVTGYQRKAGTEIASYATEEGIKGFGEGFIASAAAMGGQVVGGAVAGMGWVGKIATSPMGQKLVASLVQAGVQGVFDVANTSITAGWDAALEAAQGGGNPAAAFLKAFGKQATDPGNWASAIMLMGVAPVKVKFLEPFLHSKLGKEAERTVLKTVVGKGTNIVADTMTQTIGNTGGAFITAYHDAIKEGKTPAEALAAGRKAADEKLDPAEIANTLFMNTAGSVSHGYAEKYSHGRVSNGMGGHSPGIVHEPGAAAHPAPATHEPTAAPAAHEPAPPAQNHTSEARPAPPVVKESVPTAPHEPTVREPRAEADKAKGQLAKLDDPHGPYKELSDARRAEMRSELTDRIARLNAEPATAAPKEGRVLHETGRDQKVSAQMAQGHSGIEVHNHFMGNVEPSTFKQRMAESGLAPMKEPNPRGDNPSARVGDVSSWEPVLREIAGLDNLKHKYAVDAQGKHIIDPVTNRPVIETRNTSGDAHAHANATVEHIAALKAQLERSGITPAEHEAIKAQIAKEAQSAVEKSLRASNETDFNSAYEVRDELLKKHYSQAEANKVLGPDLSHGSLSDPAVVAKYQEHFKERPAVLAKIEEGVKAQKEIDAGRGTKELREKAAALKEQLGYDRYAKDTILALVGDNLTYSEQSNSSKKLSQRFDPEQMRQLREELKLEHPELAAKIDALELKNLTMINTNRFGERDPHANLDDIHATGKTRVDDAAFAKEVKDLVEQTKRKDVVGVDIAGAEHFAMDAKGQQRLVELYDALRAASKERGGEPIVLRPHVGEGANDTVKGKHFGRDTDRQMGPNGEVSHYSRARENMEVMIKAFEQVAAPNGGKLPPEVIVRFGHATHATPEQVARMKTLGIIAEVNLTSNVETGSVSQQKPRTATEDHAHDGSQREHHDGKVQTTGTLDDHALPTLVFNDVPIILNTDGHSVMSTNMANEYRRARAIIDDVVAGKRGIRMTGEQAEKLGVPGAKAGQPEVSVMLKDIPEANRGPVEKQFQDAYKKFYGDANDYFDRRPKPGDAPPPFDGPMSRIPVSDKPIQGRSVEQIPPAERAAARDKHAAVIGKLEAGEHVPMPSGTVNVEMIAQITAATGREVGLFRLATGERVLVLGDQHSITIPPDAKVIAHSHPNGNLQFSGEDHAALAGTRQTSSILVGPDGRAARFRTSDKDVPAHLRDQPSSLHQPQAKEVDPVHAKFVDDTRAKLNDAERARFDLATAGRTPEEIFARFGGDERNVRARVIEGSNLPNELIATRDALSPDAQRAFDAKWNRMIGGSREPSANAVAQFNNYLEAMARRGGLEAGLRSEAAKLPPGEVPAPRANDYPDTWKRFQGDGDAAFKDKLEAFRGTDNLNTSFEGGEGMVFRGKDPGTALKRWFASRVGDMQTSIDLLHQAKSAVAGNAELGKHVEVVSIHDTGPDWIVRDFHADSHELGTSSDARASKARLDAIAALEAKASRSAIEDNLLGKLKRSSANLHWSPAVGKIVVIDMQ